MTVLSCIYALNNLMYTNILVFWGTAKVYNTVSLIIGFVRCKTVVWSVVMFCSEGTEERWDIGGGIFESALDSCSIIETWHILNCSTENQQFLALSEFW